MNPVTNRARLAMIAVLLAGMTAPARADDVSARIITVPEPSTLFLLGGALAGGALLLGWIRRRRR